MFQLKPSEELRLLYLDIINGYYYSSAGFYIKHLGELDYIDILRQKIVFVNKYKKEGVQTEKERLDFLKANNDWKDQDEADIFAYRQSINDNEKNILKIIPAQQKIIRKEIDKLKKELRELIEKKLILVGTTCENLADRDLNSYSCFISLFKDKTLTIPLFDKWDDYEELEEDEMDFYIQEINSATNFCNEKYIRKLAALPFFLNNLSFAKENISTFLGRPMARLSNYQTLLISLGLRNLNILSRHSGNPPDFLDTNIDEIELFYDKAESMLNAKSM